MLGSLVGAFCVKVTSMTGALRNDWDGRVRVARFKAAKQLQTIESNAIPVTRLLASSRSKRQRQKVRRRPGAGASSRRRSGHRPAGLAETDRQQSARTSKSKAEALDMYVRCKKVMKVLLLRPARQAA